MDELRCGHCKEVKPTTEFNKSKPPRRFTYSCKECIAKKRKKYKKARGEDNHARVFVCRNSTRDKFKDVLQWTHPVFGHSPKNYFETEVYR